MNRKTVGEKVMETSYKEFKLTAFYYGNKKWPASGDLANYNNHMIYAANTERGVEIGFEYWESINEVYIKTETGLLQAFSCFLSEASCALYDFEEFCSELGYKPESRRSACAYRKCKELLEKAKKLGIDEDGIYDLINELNDSF